MPDSATKHLAIIVEENHTEKISDDFNGSREDDTESNSNQSYTLKRSNSH